MSKWTQGKQTSLTSPADDPAAINIRSMINIKSAKRDEIHLDLLNLLRFNRFDNQFFASMYNNYIRNEYPLSENQSALWEKLIHKYRKQLKKAGIEYNDVLNLPWKYAVATSTELQVRPGFSVAEVDSELIMTMSFQFNKTMIERVRAAVYDDEATYFKGMHQPGNAPDHGPKHDFIWEAEHKHWTGPYNTTLFRKLYKIALDGNVPIEADTQEFVNNLDKQFGNKESWASRIYSSNGRYYINNITEEMLPFLTDWDQLDGSIQCIEPLTKRLGLLAPQEYTGMIEQIINAANNRYEKINIATEEAQNGLISYLQMAEHSPIILRSTHINRKLNDFIDTLEEAINQKLQITTPDIHIDAPWSTEADNLKLNAKIVRESNASVLISDLTLDQLTRFQREDAMEAVQIKKLITVTHT